MLYEVITLRRPNGMYDLSFGFLTVPPGLYDLDVRVTDGDRTLAARTMDVFFW